VARARLLGVKMLRLKFLVAACALALTVTAANASTFYVSGNLINSNAPPATLALGGSLNIDVINGSVISADITLTGYPDFKFKEDVLVLDTIIDPLPGFLTGDVGQSFIPTSTPDFSNQLSLFFPTLSLIGYGGGSVFAVMTVDQHDGATLAECSIGPDPACAALSLDPVSPTTPLPAALPLFATGLGALGLLARRRKRKNAAALAAA
jgi:hypothetical protein